MTFQIKFRFKFKMGFYGFKQGRTSRVVERLKVYLVLKNYKWKYKEKN